jgi:hypothetical protein
MHRGYRLLSSLFLTAALATPVAMMGAAGPQDRDDRNQENRQGENNKRHYDKRHKDYHTWDGNEDRQYQRYQTERHEKHSFSQLNNRQQEAYWNWRHSNADERSENR